MENQELTASPLNAQDLRKALMALDRACQNLGHAALTAWNYNPPAYLKAEWDALADALVETEAILSQSGEAV
jgi:hypothetical protein